MASKTSQISNNSRFRVQFPVEKSNGSYEVISGPDMCEPDNAMSIPEIIAKYTRGAGLQVEAHPWTTGVASEDGYTMSDGEDSFYQDFITPDEASTVAPEPPIKEQEKASESEQEKS